MKQIVTFLLFILIFTACGESELKTVKTKEVDQAGLKDQLVKNLSKLAPINDDEIQFIATSLFTSEFALPKKPREFNLKVGQTFFQPDKNGRLTITLKEINEKGVILTYESKFDHRAFGKNLITIDEGQIELAYKR